MKEETLSLYEVSEYRFLTNSQKLSKIIDSGCYNSIKVKSEFSLNEIGLNFREVMRSTSHPCIYIYIYKIKIFPKYFSILLHCFRHFNYHDQ